MQRFARIVEGRVAEPLIEIEDGLDIGLFFDPEHVTLVPVTQDGVGEGWVTTDGGKTFTAPPPPPPPSATDLRAYAAAARYAKETGGITIGTAQIATDEASQAKISGMVGGLALDPNLTVSFKTATGAFVTIGADQIRRIGSALLTYVQACFSAEAEVAADIASGKVKTTADVDAAFAGVTSAFPATASASTGAATA